MNSSMDFVNIDILIKIIIFIFNLYQSKSNKFYSLGGFFSSTGGGGGGFTFYSFGLLTS